MPAATPCLHVPTSTVEAILAAIPGGQTQSLRTIERLSRWLGREADRAVQHFKPRLTMDDVSALETACRDMREVVERLQNRNNPPPLHTDNAEFKALEEWADLCRVFGFKLGPSEGRYWGLTFALLGLYAFVPIDPEGAEKANNVTMRYLGVALDELASLFPAESRKSFALPEQGTMKMQLRSNPFEVRSKRRVIERLSDSQG